MKTKAFTVSVRLDGKQHEYLAKTAKKQDISMSQVIRNCIEYPVMIKPYNGMPKPYRKP